MIRETISRIVGRGRDFLAGALHMLGSNPNVISFTGLLVNIVCGVLFALGYIVIAGFVVLFAGAFDILDGAVARIANRVTKFGGFFDSSIDRYSDLIVLAGVIIYFARLGNIFYVLLTLFGLIGTVLISYTRARGENFISSCNVGYMQRPERCVTLAIGSIFNHLIISIWFLAVITQIDAFNRIWHTRQELKRLEGKKAGQQ